MKILLKTLMKNKLHNIILSTLGLVILSVFIWFKFIRERLPRDIPFHLSFIAFIFLLYICIVYIYIIYSLVIEKKYSNAFITNLITNIFKPLKALDHSIKNHILIHSYYKHFIIYLSNKLYPILNNSKIYYYTFVIFPRLVLVTTLWIDVFYFYKLLYIYKVLLIGILLLINRYIIYSLDYAKEHFISQLEPLIYTPYVSYDHEICTEVYYNGDKEAADDEYDSDTGMCLKLRDLIKYKSEHIYCNDTSLTYKRILIKDEYYILYRKKHNIPIPDNPNKLDEPAAIHEEILKEVYQKIENILKIAVLLLNYEIYNEYTPEIKRMKILIFSNYLICWSYILIVSLHTLNISDVVNLIANTYNHEEPF